MFGNTNYSNFLNLPEKDSNIIFYGKVDITSILSESLLENNEIYLIDPDDEDILIIESLFSEDKYKILSNDDYFQSKEANTNDTVFIGENKPIEDKQFKLLIENNVKSIILTSLIQTDKKLNDDFINTLLNFIEQGHFNQVISVHKNKWIYVRLNKSSNQCDRKKENMNLEINALLTILKEIDNIRVEQNIKTRNYKANYISEKIQRIKYQNEIIEILKREKKSVKKNQELNRKYQVLEKKHRNLSNSTLGKITLKYWKLRKGR